MSDLAPLVAATMREKVVDDLHAEVLQLREQLKDTRRVEITGTNGSPVYAKGALQEGSRTRGLWTVNLEIVAESDNEPSDEETVHFFPATVLNDLEVRIGGVLYASSSEQVLAQMNEREWDGEMKKEVLCHFGGTVGGVWVPIRISGWPQNEWMRLQEADFGTRGQEDRLDVYTVIQRMLGSNRPEAKVTFTYVSFFLDAIKPALSPQPEEETEEEQIFLRLISAIADSMRAAGYTNVGQSFRFEREELQFALFLVGVFDTGEAFDREMPHLIQMQQTARETGEDFHSLVRLRYGLDED